MFPFTDISGGKDLKNRVVVKRTMLDSYYILCTLHEFCSLFLHWVLLHLARFTWICMLLFSIYLACMYSICVQILRFSLLYVFKYMYWNLRRTEACSPSVSSLLLYTPFSLADTTPRSTFILFSTNFILVPGIFLRWWYTKEVTKLRNYIIHVCVPHV